MCSTKYFHLEKNRLDILFPYPLGEAAPQRFRIEQYLPLLQEKYEVNIYPFWSTKAWKILYKKGHALQKLFGLFAGFAQRKMYVLKASKTDYIYIHREATPIGPPFIEWILAKVLKKKIIYDFDDAIWLPNQSEANKGLVKNLKYHKKVGKICSWAHCVCVGNEFLAEYARKFNSNVVVIPTTVDIEKLHNPEWFTHVDNEVPVIGWTGTHSTLHQLELIWPVLDDLFTKIPFAFHIISDSFPEELPEYVRTFYWNKESEMQDLMRFDVGIMPLKNSEWEKGKCGFKLIQYMALEIPAIASDVGVNGEIIANSGQGFLIEGNEQHAWKEALMTLLENPELRKEMGQAGRKRIIEKYSMEANKEKVIDLFKG